MRKENLSVSESAEVLQWLSKIRREPRDIAANQYYGALLQHEAYVEALGISDTKWAENRRQRLRSNGLSAVYKELPAQVRILSCEDVEIPRAPIVDERTYETAERGHDPPAGSKASADPTMGAIPIPPPQERRRKELTEGPELGPGPQDSDLSEGMGL